MERIKAKDFDKTSSSSVSSANFSKRQSSTRTDGMHLQTITCLKQNGHQILKLTIFQNTQRLRKASKYANVQKPIGTFHHQEEGPSNSSDKKAVFLGVTSKYCRRRRKQHTMFDRHNKTIKHRNFIKTTGSSESRANGIDINRNRLLAWSRWAFLPSNITILHNQLRKVPKTLVHSYLVQKKNDSHSEEYVEPQPNEIKLLFELASWAPTCSMETNLVSNLKQRLLKGLAWQGKVTQIHQIKNTIVQRCLFEWFLYWRKLVEKSISCMASYGIKRVASTNRRNWSTCKVYHENGSQKQKLRLKRKSQEIGRACQSREQTEETETRTNSSFVYQICAFRWGLHNPARKPSRVNVDQNKDNNLNEPFLSHWATVPWHWGWSRKQPTRICLNSILNCSQATSNPGI